FFFFFSLRDSQLPCCKPPPCEIVLSERCGADLGKLVVLYINELKCTDLENPLDSCIRSEH
ncbi:unnamed protein product, partial [Brassica oleracea var. botrytis]